MKKENNPKLIKEVIMLTAGTLITALGVYFFKIPNNFSKSKLPFPGGRQSPFTPLSLI